jgi:hypothetical protein
MIPTYILLFIGLISSAGAAFSFRTYRSTKTVFSSPASPNKKTLEEAVKPVLEENIMLKKKLAEAETLFRDLKIAKKLAPETQTKTEE